MARPITTPIFPIKLPNMGEPLNAGIRRASQAIVQPSSFNDAYDYVKAVEDAGWVALNTMAGNSGGKIIPLIGNHGRSFMGSQEMYIDWRVEIPPRFNRYSVMVGFWCKHATHKFKVDLIRLINGQYFAQALTHTLGWANQHPDGTGPDMSKPMVYHHHGLLALMNSNNFVDEATVRVTVTKGDLAGVEMENSGSEIYWDGVSSIMLKYYTA